MIRIFHPTDFSPASEVAFDHALKLALASQGSLTIFHLARETEADDVHAFQVVRGARCPVLAVPTLLPAATA